MKIIIIDDSEFIRNNLMRLLLNSGVELSIEEAYDVDSGKEMIKKIIPDIAIIDIRIPGGSGFELIKFTKDVSENIKVIILTNFANEQYKNKSLTEGADYFFDKSTEFGKLINVIKNI
jgi:DNA-binding NarL/FixJ family response regulator